MTDTPSWVTLSVYGVKNYHYLTCSQPTFTETIIGTESNDTNGYVSCVKRTIHLLSLSHTGTSDRLSNIIFVKCPLRGTFLIYQKLHFHIYEINV